jgi:tetratricopeptide (TPR) repeat protein
LQSALGPLPPSTAMLTTPALLALLLCAPQASQAVPSDEVREAVTRGRALLERGCPAEAEELFTWAAERDGDALRTRMWVLRAWMDAGRSDETLEALDALAAGGAKGIEMTYLYGMAFARRAEQAVASGHLDASVPMLFQDASDGLERAVAADAERFSDAWLPLANAAWQGQDLDTAVRAAETAVKVLEERVDALELRGKVALSRLALAEAREPGGAAAEASFQAATTAFERALAKRLADAAHDAKDASRRVAATATSLAHAWLWRQRYAEATDAFATAAAFAPDAVDYGSMLQLLSSASGDEPSAGFRAALELARERLELRAGTEDVREATLLWWLGWARFGAAEWAGSEEAFLAGLRLAPEISNGWYYIGLARHYRKDAEGALEALRTGWEADPASLAGTAAASGGGVRGFEGLIGWCATQEPARNLDAAFLAEVLTVAFPDEPRHWNNLGLFLRDEGERQEWAAHEGTGPEPDADVLADLYTRSFAAYERALALTPDDPQVLNDTALMLQYHLDREPERVEAMYRRSIELSERRLASDELSPDDHARFEQTRKDARGNLDRLLGKARPEGE